MSFICNICNINFSTKQRLNTHNETEKHKSIFNIYFKFNDKHNKELDEIKEKYNIIQKENENLKIQICNLIEEKNI